MKHPRRPKGVHAILILGALALLGVYHVEYGGQDLGGWNTMTTGVSDKGTYDGATFDNSDGPGFKTVTLTRPLNAQDRAALYKSLPPPNGALEVTAPDGSMVLCDKSLVSDFHTEGSPAIETIVFACTTITSTNGSSSRKALMRVSECVLERHVDANVGVVVGQGSVLFVDIELVRIA